MTKALRFLAALLVAVPVLAQAQRLYSQPELDQMLAPVALYPDPLLSQVLMAATYPAEVNEAAAWSRANPGLQGDDAVRAVQYEDWDPSVKSLVAFPQILARMAENPQWTQSLGDAFLAQEPHVMDTVQQLRRRAQAAGNLQSGEQQHVQQQGPTIVIQPASPQYIYVPYYDPLVVYGPWWWPGYRPVVWAPWPRPARIHFSLGFFFGDFDWHHRHVRVVHPTVYYYRPAVVANRALVATPHRWQHEPRRRAAVAERRTVQVRPQTAVQPTVAPRVERREERREDRQAARLQARPAPVVQAQPQAAAQPRAERREERQAVRAQIPPQVRHEQRANMPAAQAPQTPRAEREERREQREERRKERGQKG